MAKRLERRGFLKLAGQGMAALPLASSMTGLALEAPVKSVPSVAVKPLLRLNVRDYGAVGDGVAKDTASIQQTINRVSVFGGGEVVVPAGTYLIGGIALRSRVLLRLEKDAVLMGTDNFADYPVAQVRWEGRWIQGHLGLIHAIDAVDTGIVGPGKIMGNHALGGRPTKDQPLRHPCLVEPINCQRLRFEDFSTDYFRMWSMHPTNCDDLVFKNLTIRSTGGNGDGIDVDSCRRVKIDHCDISTGDDCISVKSGRGAEGFTLLRTSEDIEITNCTFAESIFACIGLGSETSGGIRNVRISHCNFLNAATHAIYIKSRPGRGAFIEDIVVNDVTAAGMRLGFLRFNLLGSGIQDEYPVGGLVGIPTAKNFRFTNIKVAECPVLVDGTAIHPSKPLEGFVFEHVSGECVKGISLANVHGAVIRDVAVKVADGPLLSISNVTGIGLKDAVKIDPPKTMPDVPVTEYGLK